MSTEHQRTGVICKPSRPAYRRVYFTRLEPTHEPEPYWCHTLIERGKRDSKPNA